MIVVIQCAASKRPNAGHLFTVSGKRVDLVAHPEIAPHSSGREYARPDDRREDGTSWRQVLLKYNEKYNESPGDNPRGLLPAYQLYKHKAYERLVYRFGPRHVYVLSAGWGLIRADFLTPPYDITFSTDADHYKRRRKSDHYEDFHLPPDDCKEDLVFF
jgi:hypothetical protein